MCIIKYIAYSIYDKVGIWEVPVEIIDFLDIKNWCDIHEPLFIIEEYNFQESWGLAEKIVKEWN